MQHYLVKQKVKFGLGRPHFVHLLLVNPIHVYLIPKLKKFEEQKNENENEQNRGRGATILPADTDKI